MTDNDKNAPSYGNVPAYDNAHPYGMQIAITNYHDVIMEQWQKIHEASLHNMLERFHDTNSMLDPVPPYTGSEPIAAIAEPKRIDEMDLDDYRRGIANL